VAYRLLLFDLDGTLLDSRQHIRPVVRNWLCTLMSGGIYVGIATGRSPRSAAPYVAELKPNGPMIYLNGALVVGGIERRPLITHTLDRDCAIQAAELARAYDVHVNAYIGDEIVIAKECAISQRSAKKDGVLQRPVGDLPDYLRQHRECPYKLLLIDDRSESATENNHTPTAYDVNRVHQPIHQALGHACDLVRSDPAYIEVLPRGVSKGAAIAAIAASYSIPPLDIIAFGDQCNDLELLQQCGFGVAMKNANPRLQAVADVVIGDNDSDAIYEFLHTTFVLHGGALNDVT